MNESNEEEVITSNLGYLGIVVSVCKILKIAERIDKCIPNTDPRIIVSTGTAVVAMILNGLGFVNHRLYMVSSFFENKPIERLLGQGIKAEHLSDVTLGKALDAIDEYGQTKLFLEISLEILKEFSLFGKTKRLDSTSINVSGDYSKTDSDYKIDYGYSKDGHSDMKQLMINLATTGESDIPFWYEIKDGNSSDKKTFGESAVSITNELKNQIKDGLGDIHISDSALYTKENLEKMKNMKWLSRVSETIKEAKDILEKTTTKIEDWNKIDDNYSYLEYSSEYGSIKQRWLVVFSQDAYKKEIETFKNKLVDMSEKLEKEVWHLENQEFDSIEQAQLEVSKLNKKFKYYKIEIEKNEVKNYYKNKGRQKTDELPILQKYKVKLLYKPNQDEIQKTMNCKGKFILATNVDKTELSNPEMLSSYKQMQGTERGFRFLKDPWFMASDVYLKKESRIASLMMIMTLCLLVYNFTQYYIRSYLKNNNQTLPNQKKKEVQNPTTRWIFQMMDYANINVVSIKDNLGNYKEIVTNIKPVHRKIIGIFGQIALSIYGIT